MHLGENGMCNVEIGGGDASRRAHLVDPKLVNELIKESEESVQEVHDLTYWPFIH